MNLHTQIIGEGTPFIILHGFLGMGDNWRTLGNRFAEEGYQVHLVDQRNHGRSFHHDEFSYTVMAQDVRAYLEQQALDKVILLGHSMGGKTAMELATTHQDSIANLIVADIAPKEYPSHHQDILMALQRLDFSEIKTRGQADKALANDIKEWGVRQFLLKNIYWKEKGQLALRMNLDVLQDKVEEIGKALPLDRRFEGKTLFLKGAKSNYIEYMDELLIHKHFPLAQIQQIDDAGHWLHADQPDEFFHKVRLFLN